MKSKIFIFTTFILVVFLFVITSCDNFLNAKNKTTININLDLSKILKTSRNETTTSITDYILKVFAYNAATYKPKAEIQNLPLLTQSENKVDINGNVKASLDVEIGLNVIFVGKLYEVGAENPIYSGNSEVVKIKATDNKVDLVLKRENADLEIDIEVHQHTFAEDWTKDETHHWYAATCEHDVTDSKAEHTFGNWTTTKEATEEAEGSKERTCTVCGYTATEVIAKLAHTHTFTDGICVCGLPEGFVLIPAGTFQMGSTAGYDPNKPVHEVTITKDFYMGKYEVTQAEYEEYCNYGGSSPSSTYGVGNNYPAYYVSWYDALVYCNKRSMEERLTPCYIINESTDPEDWGQVPTSSNSTWDAAICNWNANGYRLPTEAEWEYAARARDNILDSLTYSGTSDVNNLGDYAWYSSNSNNATHEVGTMLPNAYGLYNMSGNVWEWCWNWKTSSYNTGTEGGSDPTGALSGDYRVRRGGSWSENSDCCAVSYRSNYYPYNRSGNLGFRVVRTATEVIENLAHTHKFATEWTKDETHHWYAATCEHTDEKSGFAEHSFGNWTTTKEATEEAEGSRERSCTVCGYTATEVIEKLAHTHKFAEEWTSDATHHWYAATCEHTTEVSEKAEHSYTDGMCECGMREMVLIPAGTFQMGSNDSISTAKPVQDVTITKSFYMGKFEVTQAEYEKYCSYTGSGSPSSRGDGDNYPAYWVNWYDALVYCNKRSITEGLTPCYSISGNTDPSTWGNVPSFNDTNWIIVVCDWEANGYRLPTEAEWEYAARAGDNISSYAWSGTSNRDELVDYAWFIDNSNDKIHEVGTKKANSFGLYDMSGNVEEWCWNWYTSSYSAGTEGGSDPTGASSGTDRVTRGGCWRSYAGNIYVNFRNYNAALNHVETCGFRVVRLAE